MFYLSSFSNIFIYFSWCHPSNNSLFFFLFCSWVHSFYTDRNGMTWWTSPWLWLARWTRTVFLFCTALSGRSFRYAQSTLNACVLPVYRKIHIFYSICSFKKAPCVIRESFLIGDTPHFLFIVTSSSPFKCSFRCVFLACVRLYCCQWVVSSIRCGKLIMCFIYVHLLFHW